MRASVVLAGLVATASAASHAASYKNCVNKCWEYTKYVSTCTEDEGTQCLCDDSEYQNAVYQCLYSQCQTSHFANALHYTLAICAAAPSNDDAPALIRQNDLRVKRDPPSYGAPAYQSASAPKASGSVTRSAPQGSVTRSAPATQGSPAGSVSGSAYTRSYATRASPAPYASGSVTSRAPSSRASGGAGGATAGASTPALKTGAAAAMPTGMGMLAAAGMALAVLA